MEFKIISIEEIGEHLRIEIETEFGIEKMGLSKEAKYKDPFTGQFMWQLEVQSLLRKKYPLNKDNIIEKKRIFQNIEGKVFNLETFDAERIKEDNNGKKERA